MHVFSAIVDVKKDKLSMPFFQSFSRSGLKTSSEDIFDWRQEAHKEVPDPPKIKSFAFDVLIFEERVLFQDYIH